MHQAAEKKITLKISTHPCFRRRSTAPPGASPVVFLSGRSCPVRAGHPAVAAAELSARSPGLEKRAEALGARDAAAATGARRRRRDAGRRTAAGGGAQGREIPIRNPDHSAAYREERRLSCRLRAAAAAAATARHLATPSSPSQPMPTHRQVPLSSLSLSPPQPQEKRARGRKGRPG